MYKYLCDNCNWEGDNPIQANAECEDGGYPACPNGCKDKDDMPLGAILNFNHPANQMKYLRAIFNANY